MSIEHPLTIGPTYRLDTAAGGQPPLHTEWLLTDGLGGFAMGTAVGCNTRRYHGLYLPAAQPPVGRINTLNNLGETLHVHGRPHDLHTHEFAADTATVFHPHGWHYLRRFEKQITAVRWVFGVGPVRLTRQLRLVWKRQVAELTYRVDPVPDASEPMPESVQLTLTPFISLRDFHSLRSRVEDEAIDLSVAGSVLDLRFGDGLPFYLSADQGLFVEDRDWWDNFHYRIEADRRQDCVESLFVPGRFEHAFDLADPEPLTLQFGLERLDWAELVEPDGRRRHLERLVDHVAEQAGVRNPTLAALTVASDDFVVDREVDGEASTTIIAGYPWFADWGRDTMIALPGCLLTTGRYAEAARTLGTFAAHIRGGLIPNRFDDYGGDPHYNTVDASLWFVHAALSYVDATDDQQTWTQVLQPACAAVLDAYAKGTRYGIGMDDDGLIAAGSPDTQLTWMDAARDGVIFTPRHGKAVEINALWHRGLCGCAARARDKEAQRLLRLAKKVRRSFNRVFWADDLGYLVDHVHHQGVNRALRPNQVLAVSLPDSPLSQARQRQVMQAVRDRLWTPMGLRTLPPDDPHYHGQYSGSMFERDEAYHQGTVWAWLAGPFIEGWLRAHEFSPQAVEEATEMLRPLHAQVGKEALGQLHEIFDADPPHTPRGCIAQAWSVAEVLRATVLAESRRKRS